MSQVPTSAPSEDFIHELRNALNHLYDPDFLRASPLAAMLGLSGRFDTPSSLQNLLTRTIEQLKPGPGAPNKPHAQAIYDLLLYRYVQQFNQNEIANQLGVSVRHLRRQQNQAIYELAGLLWQRYGPQQEHGQLERMPAAPIEPDQVTEELTWLKQPGEQAATDLSYAIDTARLLIQPFADQAGARLVFPAGLDGLLQVHPVAFQQILLGLLTFAIKHSTAGEIHLESSFQEGWQALTITAPLPPSGLLAGSEEQQTLQSVRKMVELSQGKFNVNPDPRRFHARIAFRSVDPVTVLVVDDNAELITMMQRFTAETRYRILGLNNPAEVIEQALRTTPDLIVMDIMMPQLDGLQVLSRIKHHPILGHIPVLICSVLPQKDLASALGASGFIQKPIQREAFLTALDQSR